MAVAPLKCYKICVVRQHYNFPLCQGQPKGTEMNSAVALDAIGAVAEQLLPHDNVSSQPPPQHQSPIKPITIRASQVVPNREHRSSHHHHHHHHHHRSSSHKSSSHKKHKKKKRRKRTSDSEDDESDYSDPDFLV